MTKHYWLLVNNKLLCYYLMQYVNLIFQSRITFSIPNMKVLKGRQKTIIFPFYFLVYTFILFSSVRQWILWCDGGQWRRRRKERKYRWEKGRDGEARDEGWSYWGRGMRRESKNELSERKEIRNRGLLLLLFYSIFWFGFSYFSFLSFSEFQSNEFTKERVGN